MLDVIDSWSILAGFVGFGFLQLTYAALRISWPTSYAALSNTYELDQVARWWRLLLFRFVPVLAICAALVVTAWRLDLVDWIVVTLAIGLHLAVSNVFAFVNSFIKGRAEHSINYASYHGVATLLVILGAVFGSLIAPFIGDFVPSPTELISNLWLAAFVGIVAAGFVQLAQRRDASQGPLDPGYYEKRVIRDTGIETLDELFEECLIANADPILMKSIMIAEVLQRPRWVRNLERLKGRVIPSGSYGVMQMASNRPISDAESIRLACAQLSGRWCSSYERSYSYFQPDENAIWSAAGARHGDKLYVDMVTEVYRALLWSVNQTVTVGDKFFGVLEHRRYSVESGVRALTNGETVQLNYVDGGGNVHSETSSRPASTPSGSLWAVELRIPIRIKEAQVMINSVIADSISLAVQS